MWRFYLCAYALLLCLVSAGADTKTPVLPTAINVFGFNTLKQVAASAPNTNVCLSPVSLHIALDMAYSGAVGDTRNEMAATLGVRGMSNASLGDEASQLLASMNTPGSDVLVTVADSLWIDSGTKLLPSFVDGCKTSYSAEVSTLDLHSPASIAQINQWVSDRTNGKIDKVLDKVGPDIHSVLANALYFKGPWTTPFAPFKTVVRPFHVGAGGADINVPLMNRAGAFEYFEDGEKQIVNLPFGKDRRFGFVVVLPKSTDGLAPLLASTTSSWTLWMSQLNSRRGDLSLPKFTVKYDAEMNHAFKQMGISRAFDAHRADFSQMVAPPNRFSIGFVKHDTFLSVDEHGAEAAAATVIGMRSQAMMRPPPDAFTMVVDHPFLCAIVDSTTGVVLFSAAIYNPGQSPTE